MSNEIIKYAFTAGEVSPTLFGRSDLEQYDTGLAVARNWLVDYRGGLTSRAGFEFCDFIMHDDLNTRFFEFRFSPEDTNIYLLLFGHQYIRFIQDGAYLVEAAKTITNIVGNVVTSNAHGYANGDWIKISEVDGIGNINSRTFQVAGVTANTFQLLLVPALGAFVPTGAYVSGGEASRIYTVATPYVSNSLANLYVDQWRDLLRITHTSFRIRNLIRNDHTDWQLEIESTGITSDLVENITATPADTGDAGTLITVTAVLEDETETLMAVPIHVDNMVNYTTEAGYLTINWDVFDGAVSYNVYRSVISSNGGDLTKGAELGYIGKTSGTQFIDNNIIPDFTKTPPVNKNPFVPYSIDFIQVTAGGSGYSVDDTVTITDPDGSGFVGFPIVDSSGAITGVKIISGGSTYTNPTVVFSGGTGATATASTTPSNGYTPGVSSIFQQRQLYAASTQNPLTVWGSRPKKYSDFTYSELTLDNDSYEFEVDAKEVSPILHMLPMRGGLVLMSKAGIWQLSGGNSGVVTPTNALADPQTWSGVNRVPPLVIGSEILYNDAKGSGVRLLSYNEYAKVYSGDDKSLVSNHLFAKSKSITSWSYAEIPYKVVYGVRSDGALLNFAIVKETKTYAWTWSTTKGQFKDCKVIQENLQDRPYVVVRRFINGRWTKFIERGALREFDSVEDAFCVDCGLTLPQTYPNATLDASAASGDTVTFTAGSAIFTADDVGKILRMGGGKAVIETFNSTTELVGKVLCDITDTLFEDPSGMVLQQAAGTWTLDEPQTTFSGLWHLEGQSVSVLADGAVHPPVTVTNGSITLEVGATKVHIGLPYTCVAQTLPPVVSDAVIESRRKRVLGVATRVYDTVGLSTGNDLNNLYPAKERIDELWGEPVGLFSGFRAQLIEPIWDDNGQTYFVQSDPLPATLLGLVFEIEVGDDPD